MLGKLMRRVVVVVMQVLVMLDLPVSMVLVFLAVPVVFPLWRPHWGRLVRLQRYPFL